MQSHLSRPRSTVSACARVYHARKKKGRGDGPSFATHCQGYFVRSLAASLAFPAALCAAPLALSIFPSACSLSLPVRPPTASFTAPLALSAAPFTCSLFIAKYPF